VVRSTQFVLRSKRALLPRELPSSSEFPKPMCEKRLRPMQRRH